MQHLSIVDGAFLHLESAEMPMHVGSLNMLEPPAGYTGEGFHETLRAHVASRLHLASVFTRKLAPMPFDLANPVWIDDDDIDLDYHVRHMVLPKPGSMAQLEALVARLHSMLLDRSRPLWEFYVIEGLADVRIGFYGKVHHAAVDGQAGVAMATSMFDLSPEPRPVKPPRERRGQAYQLGVAELLAAALANQARQLVQSVKLVPSIASTLLDSARAALAVRKGESAEERAARQAEAPGRKWKLAPATPFNRSITNQRSYAAVSLPLDEVKALGKQLHGSINDSVLWLCATALRTYLKEGRELPEDSLVAFVPISLRSEGDKSANNQVAGTLLDLATDEADPMARWKAIRRGTAAMKRSMGTFGGVIPTDFPSLGSPWLLSGLAALYGRSRIADWLRVTNVAISNVPGSRVPVWLCGAKMVEYFPVSIVGHGVALNITVQSHVDRLCVGLIACRRAVPDVALLGRHLVQALDGLRKLAPAQAAAEIASAADLVAVPASAPAPAPASAGSTPGAPPRATPKRRTRAAAPASRPPRAKAGGPPRPVRPPAGEPPPSAGSRKPRLRVVAP